MTTAIPDPVDTITEQWARERPDLETTPMAILGRMNRVVNAVAARQEKEYGRFGISRGEFDVLATLRRADASHTLSPRRLSASLMLTTGGMTGRLDKLEKAGLVERSPDPDDRRGLRVTLTPRGLDIVDEAVSAGLEVQREALGGLSSAQAAELNDLLRTLMVSLDS